MFKFGVPVFGADFEPKNRTPHLACIVFHKASTNEIFGNVFY